MKSSAIITVMCNVVGTTRVSDKSTITQAGWAKTSYDSGSSYRNRVAWTVSNSKGEDTEQFATISCFGKRYDWIAENIRKGALIMVTGKLTVKPAYGDSKNPQIEIDVMDITLGPKSSNSNADTSDQGDAAPAPAPARQAAPAAAPRRAVPAPAADEGDVGLPF